jgi:hypothetical protein
MADHARVCWVPVATVAGRVDGVDRLDLPLDLDQNRHHPFHPHLSQLRRDARTRAREAPTSS